MLFSYQGIITDSPAEPKLQIFPTKFHMTLFSPWLLEKYSKGYLGL
jgi:hypothetical protein